MNTATYFMITVYSDNITYTTNASGYITELRF